MPVEVRFLRLARSPDYETDVAFFYHQGISERRNGT